MSNHIKINDKIKPFKKKLHVSPDKSISIRCVLLASQAIGQSKIYNLLESEDVISALRTVKKLGINYKKFKNYFEKKNINNSPIITCDNSIFIEANDRFLKKK